ncbi:MAG: sugar phosphate nucleotidyltransferase [Candidatus Berkelbacteria bacterium]
MYAVIMASGQGTRLWPMSRQAKPKQFHSLIGKNTLIQDTYNRLLPKYKPTKIFVTVAKNYLDEAIKQLPDLPIENFIIEPYATGTLGTCALATATINKLDPNSSIAFLPSDHMITEPKSFLDILGFANDLVDKKPNHLVLIGINPTQPDTGMGYIQMDSQIEVKNGLKAFSVKRFVEKPDRKTAEKYVAAWEYLWNGGMFVWKTKHAVELYRKYAAKTYRAAENIAEHLGADDYQKIAEKEYRNIDKTSVDYAICEKERDILVLPGDFGWSDVGSWGTISEVLREHFGSSLVTKGNHIGVDDKNCMVIADHKLVATVGLEDIVVIDTEDAILICKGDQSQKVKELIEKLKADGKNLYL